jgi:hypothetical protein
MWCYFSPPLFGAAPHFTASCDNNPPLPESLHESINQMYWPPFDVCPCLLLIALAFYPLFFWMSWITNYMNSPHLLSALCRMSACRFVCPNADMLCRVGDMSATCSGHVCDLQECRVGKGVQNDTTCRLFPTCRPTYRHTIQLKHKNVW